MSGMGLKVLDEALLEGEREDLVLARVALVEKFYSVQGEGYHKGRPAFFIRFAGCNLDCVFADGAVCDTPWRKAREKVSLGKVVQWVDQVLHNYDIDLGILDPEQMPLIVITGGEPTLAPAFDAMVAVFQALFFEVAVETNGTRMRKGLEYADWVVVSPKHYNQHGSPLTSAVPLLEVIKLAHEIRVVVTGPYFPVPETYGLYQHYYLSPALEADGEGMAFHAGVVPNFVKGAVGRCLEISLGNPVWRVSPQMHKWLIVH